MTAHRPWLPAAAIARGVADAPVTQVVADWSAAWFAGLQAGVRRDATVAPVIEPNGGWALADGIAVLPAVDAVPAMIALLFGAPPPDTQLTTADETALDAAVQTCLADLRARLAAGFRLAADVAWRPAMVSTDAPCRWAWRVEAERRTLLHVTVDERLIVRRIRATLPPARTGGPLPPLADALAAHTIGVSAFVGRCRLTTAELGGLATGDVVVLDRALGDRIALAVDRTATAARCVVDQHDDRLNLVLVD